MRREATQQPADAKQDADAEDEVAGPGNGFVDIYDTDDSRRIRSLVARGFGVAILPRSDADEADAAIAVAALEPPLTRDITLAWRAERRHSPAAAAFLDLAQHTFQ